MPTSPLRHPVSVLALGALLAGCHHAGAGAALPRAALETREYVAPDSNNFHVVSVIISGPTEAILVDAQNSPRDGQLLAERIAATGKHLTAIVVTHPDHDHYTGAAAVVQRFPGTPLYMTPAAIAWYDHHHPDQATVERMRSRLPPGTVPDSFVTPRPLTTNALTVDGVPIEVVADQQGDVEQPLNSWLWIPSLQTVVAGDVVFNHVHLWLWSSSAASRAAWRSALDVMAARHPRVVIAGHKASETAPDSPEAIAYTRAYLAAFDSLRASATTPDELIAGMRQRYPDAAIPLLLVFSSRISFQPPRTSGQ